MNTIIKRAASFLLSFVLITMSVLSNYSDTLINAKALSSVQIEFVEKVASYAQQHYEESKILPSFVAAQALLESKSGDGLSSLAEKYYNFWGMKAGSYTGKTVELKTTEYDSSGNPYTTYAEFRAYDSFEEGVLGYYDFINGLSRYHNIIGVTDYKKVCQLIREDGWATDPQYTRSLISLIETYELTRYDIWNEKKWYDDYDSVDLGESFYAQIICQDNACYLSNMEGNVGGADPIGTKNQIWHFVRQDDGSYAILSYYDDLSMDVYAASTDNATNIQMMPYVGNTAQKFWIYSINGAFYFRPQCTEYPFTINRQNNDNLEVWYFDPTFTNKRFDIIKMDLDGNIPISIGGDFYAQMVCEDGESYLSNMEENVGGADPIGTKNQIWHFKWLNDGSYSITSYYDGLSMDVAGAKTDNATNMQMMPYVGNTAQKFWIYSINGAYYIRSQCNPYPFTINRQNNDNLELWYYDSTFKNKRFNIIKMDCGGNLPINVEGSFNGDFYGKIKCNTNGKYLTNTDNNVVCADDTYNNDQVWHFKWQHDGSYSITSYSDEKSMDIYCAKEENGTNVQMMPYVGNTAQRFWIYNMNDAYYIQPLCSALPFTLNGDNLEIWIYDKTFENKKFDIIEVKPYSNVEGDFNNDGKFNVSDVVLLQKWLLAVPDTHFENWKAADMCEDNRLDVFDLCMMKRKLIYD